MSLSVWTVVFDIIAPALIVVVVYGSKYTQADIDHDPGPDTRFQFSNQPSRP